MTLNSSLRFYLDANASYGPSLELETALTEAGRRLFNPSSIHQQGQIAKAAIEDSRDILRRLISAGEKDSIIFNSGATEGNNQAIRWLLNSSGKGEIVSCSAEHPSVLASIDLLRRQGFVIHMINPDSSGLVTADAVAERCNPETRLVTIMLANNETGALTPVAAIAEAVRRRAPHAIIHTDAVQAVGKIEISFKDLNVDLMTITAHKMGGLSGIGALVVRDGIDIDQLIVGGPQEGKLRGGTENVLGISTFGHMAAFVSKSLDKRIKSMAALRDSFEKLLIARISDIEINCAEIERLPNTSSIYIPGLSSADLLVALDRKGMAISAGAACSSGKPQPSHVLLAYGQAPERIKSTIRVSFRADQEVGDMNEIVSSFVECIERCRAVKH